MPLLAHRHHIPRAAAAVLGSLLALTGCASTPPAPTLTTSAAAHTVTFTITGQGTATVTWPGGTNTHTALPWSTTRRIPLGPDGLNLTVQLDTTGGQATCAITIDGRRLVTSLAQGANSRATCHTPSPTRADG